eukprot:gene17198-22718_t
MSLMERNRQRTRSISSDREDKSNKYNDSHSDKESYRKRSRSRDNRDDSRERTDNNKNNRHSNNNRNDTQNDRYNTSRNDTKNDRYNNRNDYKVDTNKNYKSKPSTNWGNLDKEEEYNKELKSKVVEIPEEEKGKIDFNISGALAKDTTTGNLVNGIVIKYSEPVEAAKPIQLWRFYVFKDDNVIETFFLHRKSFYLIGRDERVADIITAHPSCSKQHAIIQYRAFNERDEQGRYTEVIKPYLLDLGTTNKTFLNGAELEEARYYELKEKDCIKFGSSTREYVLLHDKSVK